MVMLNVYEMLRGWIG